MSLALGATLAAASPAPIVGGAPTGAHPAVGALLGGIGPGVPTCTATLIGCGTLVTAAHCVCPSKKAPCQGDDAPDPLGWNVYLEHAGMFPVDEIVVHPDFAFPAADLAILRLSYEATSIPPVPLSADPVGMGTAGLLVGFGTTGGSDAATGIKREGPVTTAACPKGIDPATMVCWTYDGAGANGCTGDAGGPLLVAGALAGVGAGGTKSSCLKGDRGYDVRIAPYRDWIAATGGDDVGATCGYLRPIGAEGTTVTTFTGTVTRDGPEAVHAVPVPERTEELRVGLHAADDGRNDFDLYVRFGAPPTLDDWDCAEIGPGQYGYCELIYPDAGTWYAMVRREAGEGVYQIAATTLPEEDDDEEEFPFCGDDLLDPTSEECDGFDDAACPGMCDFDCLCLRCDTATFAIGQIQLVRKFLVRGQLGGLDPSFDPRLADLVLSVEDVVANSATMTIPADDPGWRGSKPNRGLWRWRGRTDGLRKVVLQRRRSGTWSVAVAGRDVPDAETVGLEGLVVRVRSDWVCGEKRY
ncbi:MAG: trypsin-like serine protease [bacterium]|nr:trypsin-like serine protease [bacterium]